MFGIPYALIAYKSSRRPLEKYIEQPAAEMEYNPLIIMLNKHVRKFRILIEGIMMLRIYVAIHLIPIISTKTNAIPQIQDPKYLFP